MDKNRRGFMAWLAGFFGLGAVAGVANADIAPKNAKGFIYVSWGTLTKQSNCSSV